MVDVVDSHTRSRMMGAIRGANTLPERRVRSYLHRVGLRFVLGGAGLPGRPDLVLPRFRAAVFVHGCFWHRHAGCAFATTPATNAWFWQDKFNANMKRDARVEEALVELAWRPLTIWECETRAEAGIDQLFWQIVSGE